MPRIKDSIDEMLHLLREIHKAVCPMVEEEAPKRRQRGKAAFILAKMAAGNVYIAENFLEDLKEKGFEEVTVPLINVTLNNMVVKGMIARVRKGIYRALNEGETPSKVEKE